MAFFPNSTLAGATGPRHTGLVSSMSSTDLDARRLRSAVEKVYARVATDPGGAFHFHRGAEYAVTMLGYDREELAALPEASTQAFAGVANPHVIDPLRPGEVVLDIGSGSGTDLLLAARRVGPSGHAIGVDMTGEMLARCRVSIVGSGLENVELRAGDAENLPLDDATVDAVISNGVLNLVPGKERAFREIYRVLKPGGRLMLGDIVVSASLPQNMRFNIDLWTG
jgi:arsenite methyltransferase